MISLNLYDPLLYGNQAIGNYSVLFSPTWRRTIRRRGGFYLGTVELTGDDLTRAEIEEFFRYRLLSELRETVGGMETWRGFIAKMEYSRGNQLFTIDITRMSNATRVIYTHIFDNLLTNGSGESGAWAAYGSPTSVTQDTTWKTDGTYSIKIVTPANVSGATIQAAIAIVAGQSYVIEGRLNVAAGGGSWRVSANRADNDASLAHFSTRGGGAGDYAVSMLIPPTNTYAGNVDLRITSEGSAGTVYADAFSFRISPIPNTQTGWYEDTQSITVHGRKEQSILEVGKTSTAANAEAQSWLTRWSWPQPFPPTNYTTQGANDPKQPDRLTITFAGYWAMLNWLNIPLGIDTGTTSDLITSLVNLQSTYIIPGSIETNATLTAIDNRGSLLVGDTIKDLTGDGKAGGQLYTAGVLANRIFNYRAEPAELTYNIRGGDIYSTSGALYEPWLARPGYALYQDLPIGPGSLAAAQNDPRWIYLEEIEMLPEGKLTYNLEPTL